MHIDFILREEYNDQPWAVAGDQTDYNNFFWGNESPLYSFDKEPSIEKPSEEHLLKLWNEKYSILFENKKNKEARLSEYPKTQDLMMALWKKVMENDSSDALALQEKIEEIDDKYPIVDI